ncbi:hypothetical protein ACHWQZ_G013107 [Mnemiopsis leidyi]
MFTARKWIFLIFLISQTSANYLPPLVPPNLKKVNSQIFTNLTLNLNEILASLRLQKLGNSTECGAKISQLVTDIKTGNPESVAFLDALGKPGPGVTTGNFLLLGNYDMCGTGALGNQTSGNVYKNCVVMATLKLGSLPLSLTWTGCSPPECSSTSDVRGVLDQIAALINKSRIIQTDPSSWSVQCDVEQKFDAGAYVAVMILSLSGFLVVVGTMWYLLEPVVLSITDRGRDDTTVLVQAEETEHGDEDPDKKLSNLEEKYRTSNQSGRILGLLGPLLKCFSLQKTMGTLFSTSTKPGQVLCLNGIRVLSINWVVLGHAYAFSPYYIAGYSYVADLMKRRGFMVIQNGLPSVDSFFALSGFLVTYLLLKQLSKRGGMSPLQWVAFYVHRYVRLTVPYLVAMLVEGWLYRLLTSGPRSQQMFSSSLSAHETCKKYWYTNLLYINNLVPFKGNGGCLGQGWYLANDMQFFILAPIFIVLLFWRPLIGLLGTIGSIVSSAIAAAVITAVYHLGPAFTADTNQDDYWLLYNKPWIRITPYLVGILGGWVYWRWGGMISTRVERLPEWLKVVYAAPLWAVTAAVQYGVVCGLYQDIQKVQLHHINPSEVDSVFYQSTARIAWSLSLTLQILLCQCGLGGFINSLLSWTGWQILARLTYSVFLLHIGLMTVLFGQLRHPLFLNPDFEFSVLYLGILAISYLSAAVLYLTVEQPIANLEAMTYRKTK